MKASDIKLRDPYVLLHEGTYYLYGTCSRTCWGPADCFECYTSGDLVDWEGPFQVFHRPEGFFADRCYWAPECILHQGRFYLIATLGAEHRKKGVYALVSDSPLGPFHPAGDRPLTPEGWTCIDGSLYRDQAGKPYLLFSRSFEDGPDGDMCVVELDEDLSCAAAEPRTLFSAADAPWTAPIPFAKAEFQMDGDVYLSDGPCAHRLGNGALTILWASWSDHGYAVGAAISRSGNIYGPWEHLPDRVFPENGGHGMLFTTKEGQLLYTLHYPNDKGKEHPIFKAVHEQGDVLRLSDGPMAGTGV